MALFLCLVVLIVLSVAIVRFQVDTTLTLRASSYQLEQLQCSYAAESGLVYARKMVNELDKELRKKRSEASKAVNTSLKQEIDPNLLKEIFGLEEEPNEEIVSVPSWILKEHTLDVGPVTVTIEIHDENANGLYDSDTELILDTGVYTSDDGTLQLDSGHTVPQGQSHAFLIVYQLTFTATAGETFQFNVTQIRALGQTSGLTLNLPGPPFTSAVKTMVGCVEASAGHNTPDDHDWTPNGITPNVLLQLDLLAIGEDFTVTDITLSFTRGDTAHVIAVLIILDVDGNGVYDATDELVGTGLGQATQTINLDPTVLVSQGETEHFLIALTMATTAVEGATYSVDVTDVDVVGAIDSSTQVVSLPIRSSTKTIIAAPPLPIDPLFLILAIVIVILVILIIVLCIRRRKSS